jgi:hypothetical protein
MGKVEVKVERLTEQNYTVWASRMKQLLTIEGFQRSIITELIT